MKKVYIVQLGNPQEPIYPELCAVCGKPAREPFVALSLDAEDARSNYLFYPRLEKKTLKIQPFFGIRAHHQCIKKVQHRLIKLFILIPSVAATIAAIGILLEFGLFPSLIAAIVFAVPLFFFVFSTPMPVEYFIHENDNLFSFTNHQYAKEFALLNHVGLREEKYKAGLTQSSRRMKKFIE